MFGTTMAVRAMGHRNDQPGPRGPMGMRGPPGFGSGITGVSISRTVGGLISEARQLLNDEIPISGESRYADNELTTALNDALEQTRSKRPDAFLRYGLRIPLPIYVLPADAATLLPIEDQFHPPLLFYVVGRSELTEDTFSDDNRAVTMMGKFTSMLLKQAG